MNRELEKEYKKIRYDSKTAFCFKLYADKVYSYRLATKMQYFAKFRTQVKLSRSLAVDNIMKLISENVGK